MNLKKIALCLFATTTVGTVASVATISNSGSILALADTCQHEGSHYSERLATKDTSGCKEYWVCCKCHTHWLSKPVKGVDPEYVWEGKGEATEIVDSSDDRFVASGVGLENQLKELGFKSVNVTYDPDNGSVVGVSITDYQGQSKTVIVPEGVTALTGGVAHNKAGLDWMVLPSTCTSVEKSAFASCHNFTLYFVGDTNYIASNLNGVSAIYKVEGTGWKYVNGTPTPIK